MAAPPASVKKAVFMTRSIDTGPAGDNDTQRTLATIRTVGPDDNNDADGFTPAINAAPGVQRFEGLATAAVNAKRKLYFSEVISDPQRLYQQLHELLLHHRAGANTGNPNFSRSFKSASHRQHTGVGGGMDH